MSVLRSSAISGLGISSNDKICLRFSKITPQATSFYTQNGLAKPSFLVAVNASNHIHALECGAFTPAVNCNNDSRLLSTATRSSSFGAQADTADDGGEARNLAHALHLAFLATQDKSLFSAKCFIETAMEIYRRGYTLDNVKLDLTLTNLTTGDPLKPIMLDILLTWTAVVMMTLQSIGVPLLPEGEARAARRVQQQAQTLKNDDEPAEHEDRMSQALEWFAKDCIQKFLNGTNLFRLQLQQSMAAPIGADNPEIAGRSQAVDVMQQNTRLSIITLELVKSSGIPTTMPLDVKMGLEGESGHETEGESEKEDDDELQKRRNMMPHTRISYIDGFIDPSKAPSPSLQGAEKTAAIRSAATRLLVSFNGAALSYLRSARDFVDQLYLCYSAGWSADELFSALNDEEFAQSGGISFSIANTPGGRPINAALFARWITLSYMAMALLGVKHPGAIEKTAWAWVKDLEGASGVSTSGGLEAHAIADFVNSTLRIAMESDVESGGDEEARQAGGRKWGSVEKSEEKEQSLDTAEDREETFGAFSNGFEDPTLRRTSSFALIMAEEISLIRLTRLVVLQKQGELAAAGGLV